MTKTYKILGVVSINELVENDRQWAQASCPYRYELPVGYTVCC